jgi:hypothetical protein
MPSAAVAVARVKEDLEAFAQKVREVRQAIDAAKGNSKVPAAPGEGEKPTPEAPAPAAKSSDK